MGQRIGASKTFCSLFTYRRLAIEAFNSNAIMAVWKTLIGASLLLSAQAMTVE
jgi:hypothetical protein